MQVNHQAIVALALAASEAILIKLESGQEVTPQEMKNARIYIEKAQELIDLEALLLAVTVSLKARAQYDK